MVLVAVRVEKEAEQAEWLRAHQAKQSTADEARRAQQEAQRQLRAQSKDTNNLPLHVVCGMF